MIHANNNRMVAQFLIQRERPVVIRAKCNKRKATDGKVKELRAQVLNQFQWNQQINPSACT